MLFSEINAAAYNNTFIRQYSLIGRNVMIKTGEKQLHTEIKALKHTTINYAQTIH